MAFCDISALYKAYSSSDDIQTLITNSIIEGKRLRPLTANTPKSLVSIWGKSLLVRQLLQLKKFGLTDITVVTGYCKEKIEAIGVDTVFNEEYDSTNMVFSLSKMLSNLQQCMHESTLILYGDVAYADAHLASLINSSPEAKLWYWEILIGLNCGHKGWKTPSQMRRLFSLIKVYNYWILERSQTL
jgi:hypothetical protein